MGAAPNIRPATDQAIGEAAELLRAGKLVAFPTETVYGLGADATNDGAVAGVFDAKQRPQFNPLIIHVAGRAEAEKLVHFDDRAVGLAGAFWPGALSLVLPRRTDCPVSLLAGAGLETLAVRAPDHKVARQLLATADCPIAAPSANRAGQVSPTNAAHVAASLDGAVDMILDGGSCELGLESTVLDLSSDRAAILRPGGITAEDLEPLIGKLAPGAADGGDQPASPGMGMRHYATAIPLRTGATHVRPGEALLAFGNHQIDGFKTEMNLSEAGDLTEAAANLFAMMRALDVPDHTAIAVMAVPETGLGRAINDRLRRAAHGG